MKKIVSTLVGLGIGLSMLSAMNAGGADMSKAETDISWDGNSPILGRVYDGKNYRMGDESIYDAPQTAPETPATLASSSTQVVATEPAGEFETAPETPPVMPGQGTDLPQQETTTTTTTTTTIETTTTTTETTTTETIPTTTETISTTTSVSLSSDPSISVTITKDGQTAGCEISSSNLDNQSFIKIVINTIVGTISKIFS